MKKILVTAALLVMSFFLFIPPTSAAPQSEEIAIEEALLDEISLEGVQSYWENLQDSYGSYLPDLEKLSVYEYVKNQDSLSLEKLFQAFVQYFFHELILNGKLLGSLLMLTLFSAILQTMHTAFESASVSKIAYFIVYIVLIFIALNSFYLAVTYTKEAIDTMGSFMIALLPLVLGLMATIGGVASVTFFHPMIIFLIHISGVIVSALILPLLYLSALLKIVSSLSENYKVTHLAELFKQISMSVLGLFLTIFLGVVSVQGTVSAIQDGVALKTAKFVTGNFIPVVGRTFTDAAETIFSASLILKNAIGVLGLVIILLIVSFPAIKIAVISIIYKLAAAVLQPVGDGPVIQTLSIISQYIVFILACLLAVSLMFFLAIVIIVAASNITLILR